MGNHFPLGVKMSLDGSDIHSPLFLDPWGVAEDYCGLNYAELMTVPTATQTSIAPDFSLSATNQNPVATQTPVAVKAPVAAKAPVVTQTVQACAKNPGKRLRIEKPIEQEVHHHAQVEVISSDEDESFIVPSPAMSKQRMRNPYTLTDEQIATDIQTLKDIIREIDRETKKLHKRYDDIRSENYQLTNKQYSQFRRDCNTYSSRKLRAFSRLKKLETILYTRRLESRVAYLEALYRNQQQTIEELHFKLQGALAAAQATAEAVVPMPPVQMGKSPRNLFFHYAMPRVPNAIHVMRPVMHEHDFVAERLRGQM